MQEVKAHSLLNKAPLLTRVVGQLFDDEPLNTAPAVRLLNPRQLGNGNNLSRRQSSRTTPSFSSYSPPVTPDGLKTSAGVLSRSGLAATWSKLITPATWSVSTKCATLPTSINFPSFK